MLSLAFTSPLHPVFLRPSTLRPSLNVRPRISTYRNTRIATCSTATSFSPTPRPSTSSVQTDVSVPSTPITFLDALNRLQRYWADAGCILWHPHNVEVGAGTMNPATYLRVLGPEPWSVAYDEPSIRPDDARYGDNPNRLQRHTQFQVILKPAPQSPQELVVGSYRALGIDTCKHDIRFVEDNWESPALGAWGLGWEIWMDGMEVTQFTYFQQAGSLGLDTVSVEVTYGLERIVMALQGKKHFKDIVFKDGITYGEIFMQNEVEMSKYFLDEADVEKLANMFETYEQESKQLLDKRLPVPAYNYVLKASQTFNILDARGAIGVTERARYFQRMRNLSREVAKLWVERREEQGFPLLQTPSRESSTKVDINIPSSTTLGEKADLLFELGLEELPAQDVTEAISQMRKLLSGILTDANLSFSSMQVDGTPRRVTAFVRDLQTKQSDQIKRVRGPPLRAALKDGQLTKAGKGFLRSQGITDESLAELNEEDGYMYATVEIKGRSAVHVLANTLPQNLLAKMNFKKSMRWNDSAVAFSRPIRWLLCLLDDELIPFEFASVKTAKLTRSMRKSSGFAQEISVPSASAYKNILEEEQIMFIRSDRRKHIRVESERLAEEIGGVVPVESLEGSLMEEVTNLVENPIPLRGEFDQSFLVLPEEVLVTVMNKHQRYLPIVDKLSGELRNGFITVVNGDKNEVDLDAIRRGNEAVLRARYSDAVFFYGNDTRGKKLADFVEMLGGLTFQEKIGSMLDKVRRIQVFMPDLIGLLNMHHEYIEETEATAELFKADLATSMVVEMTSLAGTIGRHYASKSGEVSEVVAQSIFEANLPRFSGDQLPKLLPAVACSIADRLDSLVSLFHVGLMPKSTADPFALRRAALGVVLTLIDCRKKVNLSEVLPYVANALSKQINEDISDETLCAVMDFITKRLEGHLLDTCGFRDDVVKAVMNSKKSAVDPRSAFLTCETLTYMLEKESKLETLREAQASHDRAARLLKGVKDYTIADLQFRAINFELFETDEERELWILISRDRDGGDLELRLKRLQKMKGAVDKFFDNVLVNVDDKDIRGNRLCLLAQLVKLTDEIMDLSQLQL